MTTNNITTALALATAAFISIPVQTMAKGDSDKVGVRKRYQVPERMGVEKRYQVPERMGVEKRYQVSEPVKTLPLQGDKLKGRVMQPEDLKLQPQGELRSK